MKITTRDALVEHLGLLGLKSGMNVVVHSSLAPLGVLAGGLPTAYDALRSIVGGHATIAVPAYRIGAGREEVYDAQDSASLQVGAFSEYVRKLPSSRRSLNPIHSHAFQGPLAETATRAPCPASFGAGSDFEFMIEHGFTALFLGCDFENAGTCVFHAQAVADCIPYREWQQAVRSVTEIDSSGRKIVAVKSFPYYARVAGAPRETRRKLEARLRQDRLLSEASLPYGKSMAFDFPQVHAALVDIFRKDPLASVSAEPQVS